MFEVIPKRPIPVTEPSLLKLRWLIKIRWFAILGQATVILAVLFIWRIRLPIEVFLGVLGLTFLSNVALTGLLYKRYFNRFFLIHAILFYDIIVLSIMLWYSGGLYNPFKYMYLIHVSLAALMVRSGWKWFLVFSCVASYVCLYWAPLSPDFMVYMRARPIGEAVAFLVATAFIFSSVYKLTQALKYSEQKMQALREKQWKSEKLNSLATLAGGAAHELATPLSTIAISSSELQKRLQTREGFKIEKMDAKLIRDEVRKCQLILQQMSVKSGELHGETAEDCNLKQLMQDAMQGFEDHVDLDYKIKDKRVIMISQKTFTMVLSSLLKNAVQACGNHKVIFSAKTQGPSLCLEIQDFGEGMSQDVLHRIGEPFFSLKEPGEGMGLGVYIANAFMDSVGGSIVYDSIKGEGTRVLLKLPLNMVKA